MSSRFEKGVDDWICSDPDCKNINYARRTHCHRCKAERKGARKATAWEKKKLGTEIGKQAAEKSRGLFSAEDWQCSQCANVNWSRRQTCNMCNAPKFTEVEERTGTGGGYNERTAVEYKEKVPSDDDEFDEFGRRKKKTLNRRKSPSPDRHKRVEKEEEDEEDEEDGEEEDLSKYNLWDSDEEKTDSAAPNGKKEAEDKSKSSSASSSRNHNHRNSTSKRKSPSRSRSRSPRPRKRRYSRSSSSSSSSSASSKSSSSSARRRSRRH